MDENHFDTHLCLCCRHKMVGLDNYVRHKKFECPSLLMLSAVSNRADSNQNTDKSVSDNLNMSSDLSIADDTQTGYGLAPAVSSFADMAMTASDSHLDDIGPPCKLKQCSDVAANSDAIISDDESAVDCFFESLQLRSRYGHTQHAAVCKTDYCIPHTTTHKSSSSFLQADITSRRSLTNLRFCATETDMFTQSDTEDLLNFSGDDLSAKFINQTGDDKWTYYTEGKPSVPVREVVASNRTSSLRRKSGSDEISVLKYRSRSSRGKKQPTDAVRVKGQHDSDSSQEDTKCFGDKVSKVNNAASVNSKKSTNARWSVAKSPHRTANTPTIRESNPNVAQEKRSSDMKCCICDIEYRTKYSYARHLLTPMHKRRAKGYCRQLIFEHNEHTMAQTNGDSHLQTLIRKQQPFQCRICQFYVDEKAQLMEHIKSVEHELATDRFSQRCVRCQHVSDSSADMLLHLNTTDHDSKVSSSNGCCIIRKQRRRRTELCGVQSKSSAIRDRN